MCSQNFCLQLLCSFNFLLILLLIFLLIFCYYSLKLIVKYRWENYKSNNQNAEFLFTITIVD